jgi:ribonuclease P protein subunit POP4
MAITPYNILRHELVGLRAKVVESPDKGLNGLSGEITDETQRTITLTGPKGPKKVTKENTTLSIHTDGGDELLINGSLLLGRPEERIKKKIRIAF